LKYASKNFHTKTNMKDGAAFILYSDFVALAGSEALKTWLDKLWNEKALKLSRNYLANQSEAMMSGRFADSVSEIVNPVVYDSEYASSDYDASPSDDNARPRSQGQQGQRNRYPGSDRDGPRAPKRANNRP